MIRWCGILLAVTAAAFIHLQLSSDLPLRDQVAVLLGAPAVSFGAVLFRDGALPRLVMALVCGAGLGISGSVLQQITRNRLVAPVTVGAASGAWLALVAGTVVAPGLAAQNSAPLAMGGALLATGLVVMVAGRTGLGGLPVVLAGMAVNILFGAIAQIIVLTHDQYVSHLFIWGAGDLTQTDWSWVQWLAPQVGVGLVVILLAQRPLALLRLGHEAAAARGLSLVPVLLVLGLSALWLTASVVTAVGVIGFIGLLAPNAARLARARTVGQEIVASLLLGALFLVLTDGLAVLARSWSRDLVPSGASAALVGVPLLIWLALRRFRAQDHGLFSLPQGRGRVPLGAVVLAVGATGVLALVSLTVAPGPQGWRIGWPSELILSLRWPRTLAAVAAGAGMAVSGVVLQRLLRNPLASPDIIGISSGASLALVAAVVVFGTTVSEAGAPVALLGGLLVLAVLIILGQRQGNAPGAMALVGISLAALLDAVLQFVLAKGGEETYMIVGWLAGSTFRVEEAQVVALTAAVALLSAVTLALHRWLTLLTAGEPVALARGLAVGPAKVVLLALAAVLAALVTAVVGPIAFVGLIAPHVAVMLGARRARDQVLLATLIGIAVMVLSDWLGRGLFHPIQLPAGAMASVVGGAYLIVLLARRRAGVAALGA